MFFGLCNSPATFQHMMDDIFRPEKAQQWLRAYLNDIIIANDGNKEDLIKKTIHVLQKCEQNDLFIKSEKCEFFTKRVSLLGFILGNGFVEMEPQKVQGIADWCPPKNLGQLETFLGFCNFYHRFISHYAKICKPLNRLRRKENPWNWTMDQQ
jgi:hypothetical protein